MTFLKFLLVLAGSLNGYQSYAKETEQADKCPVAGVDYPNYPDVPKTDFTCGDKPYIPGVYADMDAGCQAFHFCTKNGFRSLMCPEETVFNQTLLACESWFHVDCPSTPRFYAVNEQFVSPPAMHVNPKDGKFIFGRKKDFLLTLNRYVMHSIIYLVESSGH